MKIFVAGASGVIGWALLPLLVKDGHEVIGMTRHAASVPFMRTMGVKPVVADVFQRDAIVDILREVKPDTVIHQLTSLSSMSSADNARIRVEGTRNLVEAALSAGVQMMIAQSISWAYEPGEGPATEDVPLDLHAAVPRKVTIAGIEALERTVSEMTRYVVLRYGTLYGPGTWYAENGFVAEQVRHNEKPATDGITSFVHVEDAARAAYLALNWPSGPVNIVDDEPAPGTQWLPIYAEAIGAPAPVVQSGSNRGERGASNKKARTEYGWEPMYPTWRIGFQAKQ